MVKIVGFVLCKFYLHFWKLPLWDLEPNPTREGWEPVLQHAAQSYLIQEVRKLGYSYTNSHQSVTEGCFWGTLIPCTSGLPCQRGSGGQRKSLGKEMLVLTVDGQTSVPWKLQARRFGQWTNSLLLSHQVVLGLNKKGCVKALQCQTKRELSINASYFYKRCNRLNNLIQTAQLMQGGAGIYTDLSVQLNLSHRQLY